MLAAAPLLPCLSPNNKPALSRQRDHSACRRPETPLKVRKTRENLKQCSLYADIPPPCIHGAGHSEPLSFGDSTTTTSNLKETGPSTYSKDAVPTTRRSRFEEDSGITESNSAMVLLTGSRMQRQKSVSRRMLSRVKQGISGRSKISAPIKHMESETSLVRRLSGRRKQDCEDDRRSQSFEVVRGSIESVIVETPGSVSFASASGPRSFTNSTVSTADVLGQSLDPITPNDGLPMSEYDSEPNLASESSPISQPPTSPSPQPTPRPPPRNEPPPLLPPPGHELTLAVPCVDLYIAMDASSVDVHSKRDIWVAIEATVRSMTTKLNLCDSSAPAICNTNDILGSDGVDEPTGINETLPPRETACGAITTLRLCFKPVQGCQLREVIGQKSVRNLAIGQQCSLFIKLRVPRIRMRDSTTDPDQDSLFTELESIIGTLKTEVLHVEARYRHSMLRTDNVVTVRHACKIKRPKAESRWSVAAHSDECESPAEVHAMLARYLESHYSPGKALELLEQYLYPAGLAQSGVREIYEALKVEAQHDNTHTLNSSKPSVIITDIDLNTVDSAAPPSQHFSTAPNTPTRLEESQSQPFITTTEANTLEAKLPMQPTVVKLAPPLLTAPKTTTAVSTEILSSTRINVAYLNEPSESQDSARQLWRHIRRTSLSAKQLQEMTAEPLHQVEADDEHLRELRRRALANKRSIGAETLRAWKWEESMQQREKQAEAPWM